MTTDEGTTAVEERFQGALARLRDQVAALRPAAQLEPSEVDALVTQAWRRLLAAERGRASTLSEVGTAARLLTDPEQTFRLGLRLGLQVAGRVLLEVIEDVG